METYEDYFNNLTPEQQEAEEAYLREEVEGEMRAEYMADWIMSGGDPADASLYAHYEMNGWPTQS